MKKSRLKHIGLVLHVLALTGVFLIQCSSKPTMPREVELPSCYRVKMTWMEGAMYAWAQKTETTYHCTGTVGECVVIYRKDDGTTRKSVTIYDCTGG